MACNSTFYDGIHDLAESVVQSFRIFDIILGVLFLGFLLVFIYFTYKEYRNSTIKPETPLSSQIVYILALLVKGTSYVITSVCREYDDNEKWGKLSCCIIGLAGYISAITYSYIFFTWAALCANYLGHDFAVFYGASKKILISIIVIVVVMFLVSISFMLVHYSKMHYIEASFASMRDFFIAIAFIVYYKKVFALSESPHCIMCNPETKIYVMCGFLITVLIFRAASILVYTLCWSDWGNLADKCREFNGYGYFTEYVIEQIILEFCPLLYIGITRIIQIQSQSYSQINVNEADYIYGN